jgi:hypothetical protein
VSYFGLVVVGLAAGAVVGATTFAATVALGIRALRHMDEDPS